MNWLCCESVAPQTEFLQLDLIAFSKFITLSTHLNRVRSSARLGFALLFFLIAGLTDRNVTAGF